MSGFGASGNCPTGWTQTPNGYCGGPPPSYRAPAATALQNALRALGKATKDTILTAVAADGVIGPATQAAVNRALTAHIGSGQAPAALRTGTLTVSAIAQNATQIGGLVTAEVGRRGGSVAQSVAPTQTVAPTSVVTSTIPVEAPELPSRLGWSLLGLNLTAAAVGTFLTFRR